ncbi:uncharacterized protein LOC125951457 isoform X1 [Anopheles darlingi]|uniref:uncharacterized protein LOC125951457 isoform X1 n=1 Tax=Anopheles darlingi TaxID=43151 RepID=UPI0021000D15|nr:uncharacterized protein LOC125951457 isoform X1 [Anopheles darlingi]
MARRPIEVEMTLSLDCWQDVLSPAQKAAYEKAEQEYNAIRSKLQAIVKESGGTNIFSGEVFTAYQVLGPVPGLEKISQPVTALATKKKIQPNAPPPLTPLPASAVASSSKHGVPGIPPDTATRRRTRQSLPLSDDDFRDPSPVMLDDDEEDYMPLSKRMKVKDKKTSDEVVKPQKTVETPKREKTAKSPIPQTSSHSIGGAGKPNEYNAVGGLRIAAGDKDKKRSLAEPSMIVDLTSDEATSTAADSREISFSKIQGKTFPSLVVVARPSLRMPEKVPNDRPSLDARVKSVLVFSPGKFTEWLIQQGLLKSEQQCKVHPKKPLKLGMYSDVSKFIHSGGYVWISECCPARFTSVFNGSLFEESSHAPSVLLKLIYHWACQTSVANVANWVKVDNMYMKRFYTLLRSVCSIALCQHMPMLGGHGKVVEVGVISLGTTSQDGQQRQVKVEVLGVLDREAKLIRLRAVDPPGEGDRSYKKRFAKILEPLAVWTHKESLIVTDLTVDKSTLNCMGYKHVLQTPTAEAAFKNSNANVMNYLRSIVPRMFQSTLSLLSRQIIQQFLNELVWREMYGSTPATTFDNILKHIAEQVRMDHKETLLARLTKVSTDPFRQWHFVMETPPAQDSPKRGRKPNQSVTPNKATLAPIAATVKSRGQSPNPPVGSVPVQTDPPKKILLKKVKQEQESASLAAADNISRSRQATKTAAQSQELVSNRSRKQQYMEKEEIVSLESYYYGIVGGADASEPKDNQLPKKRFNVACPECPAGTFFKSNVELLDHFLRHAKEPSEQEGSEAVVQCRCCLEYVENMEALEIHNQLHHPSETKEANTLSCLICSNHFRSLATLTEHMQKFHLPLEMPYRCAGCTYRSSSQRLAIEHFYNAHRNTLLLQCPFCLKMVTAYRADGPERLAQVLLDFLAHLRQHCSKSVGSKRCHKCALSFFTKGEHKFHSIFDHVSVSCDPADVQLMTSSFNSIVKPKKKASLRKENSTYRLIAGYGDLVFNMECGNICLECKHDFDDFNHTIGLLQCVKCVYQTACLRSVVNHATVCYLNASTAPSTKQLPKELYCSCGYSSCDGNALARHLLSCDRDTVYTSVKAAQTNGGTKRHMLDRLGLIQRDDNDDDVEESYHPETNDDDVTSVVPGPSALSYDPSQSLYNIAATSSEQQFNTQLSFDDLGPSSVLPTQDTDLTPQLKDDYQSLATPRVPDQPDF